MTARDVVGPAPVEPLTTPEPPTCHPELVSVTLSLSKGASVSS